MRKIAHFVAAAAVIVSASSAFAGQKQDAFDVKVKITGTCAVTAPDIDFGSLTDVAGTETKTVAVTVKCSNTLAYSLAVDAVTTSEMSGATAGNTDTIPYTLAFATNSGTGDGMGATVTADSHNLKATLTTASSPQPDDYKQARIVYVNY